MGRVARGVQKTKLRFTWHLLAEGVCEAGEVQLLCHHAVHRGVHLPEEWKSGLNLRTEVPAVDAFALSAVQRVRQELSLPEATKLDCRLHQATHKHTDKYLGTFDCGVESMLGIPALAVLL